MNETTGTGAAAAGRYTVRFVNVDAESKAFEKIADAFAFAKHASFESVIERGGRRVCALSPLYGVRWDDTSEQMNLREAIAEAVKPEVEAMLEEKARKAILRTFEIVRVINPANGKVEAFEGNHVATATTIGAAVRGAVSTGVACSIRNGAGTEVAEYDRNNGLRFRTGEAAKAFNAEMPEIVDYARRVSQEKGDVSGRPWEEAFEIEVEKANAETLKATAGAAMLTADADAIVAHVEAQAAKAVDLPKTKAPRVKKERPKSRATRWAEAAAEARSAIDDARERIGNALEELRSIQEEYQEWRDNLDGRFEGSALVEKLETVSDLELDADSALDEIEQMIDEAENCDLPRGFGRD